MQEKETEAKKQIGRPSKYKPEFDDVVIELMTVGASKIEVAAKIGITRETLNEWTRPESDQYQPSFSDSIKRGLTLSQSWWEQQARLNLENGKFNSTLWSKNMPARFKEDWADVSVTEHKGEIKSTIDITSKVLSQLPDSVLEGLLEESKNND